MKIPLSKMYLNFGSNEAEAAQKSHCTKPIFIFSRTSRMNTGKRKKTLEYLVELVNVQNKACGEVIDASSRILN
jgi:hypothetical protein